MKTGFAESYLLQELARRMHLEPAEEEFVRGTRCALEEETTENVEQLMRGLEKIGRAEEAIVVSLMAEAGPLWVREALREIKRRLAQKAVARVVIVGLWRLLQGQHGRRTPAVAERFATWREFAEKELAEATKGNLEVVWVG